MEENNNPLEPQQEGVAAAPSATEATAEAPVIDEQKLHLYMEKLKLEQNLLMGLAAGAVAMVVSAFLWAAVTLATDYQIGYMAIGVGFLVGFAIRFAGKGMDQIFGITGAVLSLIGCLLGNLFTFVGILAGEWGIDYLAVISQLDMTTIISLFEVTFSPIDLLFYGLALFFGYKYAFREITEEEILENAV